MSRAADYTIKGFLYQFNKTLLEILNSPDGSSITAEGIIEDVEIVTTSLMKKAIQCKYHEASKTFISSSIFKPLLQMMCHFHANPGANIHYILFAHYPSVTGTSQPSIGKTDLQAALNSNNRDSEKYITQLRGKVDLDKFLSKFVMEFGPSFNSLVAQVNTALKINGIPVGDIDTLAYPNAIHMIATISTKHKVMDRNITKQQLLKNLKSIRKTAISRWTMALHTRKHLLDARRKQLKTQLDKNSRTRYFVVDSKSLDDYNTEIVLFISDYIDKYHFKTAHISTPVLCLCTSEEDFQNVEKRLYEKGIMLADGYIGGRFYEKMFFRNPITSGTRNTFRREFTLRMLRWEANGTMLNNQKCDDLFIIGEPDCALLNTGDVNVEHLAATSLKEIKYVIGVSNVYE
ncbi:MAG: hypothetical protein Q7R35_00020 [Elusimicrobiota bacterium]|nr:hypothetical protein [Elusimicrobiota bacterium]